MSLHAYFIGVNKHQDKEIRELKGAVRDALGLYSIFKDTLPDENIEYLVDEQATREAIFSTLNNLQEKSAADDTVILFFSGHGTNDHQIVPYDTSLKKLGETTISMSQLAALFKSCAAEKIIIILDCCFSGGLSAKVIEDSPTSKSPHNPLNDLAGTGRVILTASSQEQEAYEHPNVRHGLLTKVLLSLLLEQTEPWSVMTLSDELISLVRTEAGRYGLDQTPQLLGEIKGGFTFPVLQKGSTYFHNFPEATGIKISGSVDELSGYNIPGKIIENWKELGITQLNPLQLEAINDKRVVDGNSLVVIAPTSSGKTFVGEVAATAAVNRGEKVVFLFPYKALASEKYEYLQYLFKDTPFARIIRCDGDYGEDAEAFLKSQYDVAVLTYETFLYFLNVNETLLSSIGLVVLDEGQFITDELRGIVVELILTYLISQRGTYNPQIILLSAVVGDINDFDKWLGIDTLITRERPFPLEEGVIDRSGRYKYRDAHTQEINEVQLLPPHAIVQRKQKQEKQDVIVPLVKHLVKNKEEIIIFRNNRGSVRGCAGYLADELDINSGADLSALPTGDQSGTSQVLHSTLPRGVAVHTSDLDKEEKRFVERAFRDNTLDIPVLVATTTLAAGINTPASAVVLPECFFWGEEGRRPFRVGEYKNMSGRAGRTGRYGTTKDKGVSVIIADTAHEREQLFQQYVLGSLEPFSSTFSDADISTWLLRLLSQLRHGIPEENLTTLILNTYGGFLQSKGNPSWRQYAEQKVSQSLQKMNELGLIEPKNEGIGLSLLGKACGNSSLCFNSIVTLLTAANGNTFNFHSPESLSFFLQILPEMNPGKLHTPVAPRTTDDVFPQRLMQKQTIASVDFLQRGANSEREYWGRCKRFSIIVDWISGVKTETIEQSHSLTYWGAVNRGDIIRFVDSSRFHLSSMYRILKLLKPDLQCSQQEMEDFFIRLEFGVPATSVSYAKIMHILNRGDVIALLEAGFENIEKLRSQTEDQLATFIHRTKAKKVIDFLKEEE